VKRLSTRKKNGSKRAAQTVGQGSANELALDYRHRIGFVFILAIDGSDRFPRDLKETASGCRNSVLVDGRNFCNRRSNRTVEFWVEASLIWKSEHLS
jgi:hypothetical protein